MKRKRTLLIACVGLAMALVLCGSACAPTPNKKSSDESMADTGTNAAVAFTWSEDSECSMCHEHEQTTCTDSQYPASQHADVNCAACHNDSEALVAKHEGATPDSKMPKVLKASTVSDETCLSCHYGTKEELKAATSDLKLVDKEGTEQNPHDLSPIGDHEALECRNCHAMHEEGTNEEHAHEVCLSCHHEDVFECHTCHA